MLHNDSCTLCPRRCRVSRQPGHTGYCGLDRTLRIARSSLHRWEEPCISGSAGTAAVFFTGCSLRCVYCQNYTVSHENLGFAVSEEELIRRILALRDAGAHSLDLVSPTPYADRLVPLLQKLRPRLGIPVIWNGSGYETPETLAMLEGLVDIYLPDFKYADEALAQRLSGAPDYPAVAARAIGEMARQTGAPVFGENGLLLRGTLVRHLVLPGHRANSMAVLDTLAGLFPDRKQILVSLMNQYTPDFYLAHADATAKDPLRRRLTTFEYESVLSYAADLGFDGYRQDRAAATADYTPRFFGSSDEEAAAGDSPSADS